MWSCKPLIPTEKDRGKWTRNLKLIPIIEQVPGQHELHKTMSQSKQKQPPQKSKMLVLE